MRNWEQALVGPNTTLREALEIIDRLGSQMVLVVDADRVLLGTLSDGDARRGLLRGLTLGDPVSRAMQPEPTCAVEGQSRQTMLATMRRLGLHQLPLINASRRVIGLEIVDDYFVATPRDQWVVIMAGGRGLRLQELTRDIPKPMLPVGSRPLLETIVREYVAQGFHRFYMAVNYKADQIESHFGDGSSLGATICYLRERERLGTAGALSLLPEKPTEPVVVTNADLLTREDYGDMVDRHVASGAVATMAVRDYEMQIPYGVVRERDGTIEAIEEKPIQRFVVSAGMYVLSPEAIELVPSDTFFDMPTLFEMLARQGKRTRCHPIDGYWLDIGRATDYEKANSDFREVFP